MDSILANCLQVFAVRTCLAHADALKRERGLGVPAPTSLPSLLLFLWALPWGFSPSTPQPPQQKQRCCNRKGRGGDCVLFRSMLQLPGEGRRRRVPARELLSSEGIRWEAERKLGLKQGKKGRESSAGLAGVMNSKPGRGGREACFKTSAARVIKQLDLQLASARHPCGACSRNPRFATGEDGQHAHTRITTPYQRYRARRVPKSRWHLGGGTLHPSGTWCTSGVRPGATSHIWTAPRWQRIWAASQGGPSDPGTAPHLDVVSSPHIWRAKRAGTAHLGTPRRVEPDAQTPPSPAGHRRGHRCTSG